MTALVLDPVFERHRTEPGHPEAPARIRMLRQTLAPEAASCLAIQPRAATLEEVALAHHPHSIEAVLRQIEEGVEELAGGDVSVGRESGHIALLAAGSVIEAIRAVLENRAHNAFCAVRPPGHHARPAAPMGFCIFNNVAIGARYALRQAGLERVAIVDWDVHHGNGTQEIFWSDGSVLFFSTHQWPWYPGTGLASERGEGAGEGKIVNCPLPAGADGEDVIGAFRERLLPALASFRPELLLISCGFDSRVDDPLGQLRLSDADFAALTRLMLEQAAKYCDGRCVSVLEGGYNLPGLASAAREHLRALMERK